MDFWQWALFSFDGRITRKYFWLGVVIVWVIEVVVFGLLAAIFGFSFNPTTGSIGGMSFIGWIIWVVVLIAVVWMGLAIQIKRWHDRAKSGWWVLITLIPLVGPIWALVECGFLPGTDGTNQYGEANLPPTAPFQQ